jgi:hypothetical protein
MNKTTNLILAAALAAGATAATADDFNRDAGYAAPVTIAVFGDWPYNTILLDSAPLLINSVNADKDVSLVLHVGDIHSGSMPCTSADILPPISSSNPGWNQKVYDRFQQFRQPFVYTPGDNEWTDCHKSKEKSSGDPLKELSSVRGLFFARPGRTLGLNERRVWSQAQHFDPAHLADAQFVENVMWRQGAVVFVTVDVPGSNNDTAPWTGIFSDPSAQDDEVAARNAANLRWLAAAFGLAKRTGAKAVVIGQQADMWDPEALASNELYNYTPYVQTLAQMVLDFGRPVLLLNGDSHVYGSDKPLADPTSATGKIHNTPAVPNLTRITVQGSTNAPAEWLKLTIDPRKPQMFSWTNVPYCNNPAVSCP